MDFKAGYYDFIFLQQLFGGHFENGKFDSDRTIFQLGDSDFRILREIFHKNEDVSIFY